jgi:sulfite oxidase
MKERGIPMIPITHPLEMDLQSNEEYLEEMKKKGGRDPVE